MSKKVGVLLSGCGVYDGSEIHESVLSLLALEQKGFEAVCFAPNVEQHHVINHLNGDEMDEKRNVLVESARIARGEIKDLKEASANELDGLLLPGGFGAAKNHTKWAFAGPDGEILPEVKQLILDMVKQNKPIAGLCMSPTTIAKALEGTEYHAALTVGTTASKSPYEIDAISQGMESIGAKPQMKEVEEYALDEELKIITTPCYMMEAGISEVHNGIQHTVNKLAELL